MHVDARKRGEVGLIPGLHLHHDVIGVERTIELCDERLAEGVVERLLDGGDIDTEPGGGVAIDAQHQPRAAGLLIAGEVEKPGKGLELSQHFRAPLIDLVRVDVLERVLVLGAREPCPDPNVLDRLHEGRDAGYR